MILHLVFHDIYKDQKDIKRKIDITLGYFLSLRNALDEAVRYGKAGFDYYTFHFDEGYESFKTLIEPTLQDLPPERVLLAIRAGCIGQPGFLTAEEIKTFDKRGFVIASHSVSHPILALPQTPTPPGGKYQNMPFGEDQLLSENEIYFQLNESKKALEDIVKHEVTVFALPFGGWNETASEINRKHNLYKTIYTSEDGLDAGNGLFRPRYGIRSTRTIEETVKEILQLDVK